MIDEVTSMLENTYVLINSNILLLLSVYCLTIL